MLTYLKKILIKYFTPSFITSDSYKKAVATHSMPSVDNVSRKTGEYGVALRNDTAAFSTEEWNSIFENVSNPTKHQELDIPSLRSLTNAFHSKIIDMQQSVLLKNNINIDKSDTDFKELTKIIKSNVDKTSLSDVTITHETVDVRRSPYVITKDINSEKCKHPVFYHIRVVSGTCIFEYKDKNTNDTKSFSKTNEDFIFGVCDDKKNADVFRAICDDDCEFCTLFITEYSFEYID